MFTPLILSLAIVQAKPSEPVVPSAAYAFTQGSKPKPATPVAKPEINVSLGGQPLTDGTYVAGEITIVVKVVSKDPVNNVEFYVGDDIRDTDNNTPYEFKIDTLAEADGDLKFKFMAYTSEGENATKTITVKVDNGVGKGAAWNVEQGNDALAVSDWDKAIRFGRVALKADPKFNPARLLMARAFKGKGVLDSAQKFAEDAVAADPNYLEAADFLSAITLERAFSTFNRGGDRTETLNTIGAALKRAVESRRKVLDANLDKFGAPTEENRLKLADYAIKAGRYSLAINALQEAFRKNSGDSALANRIAYAQLRAGRLDDAALTMQENSRSNGVDGYGYALIGVIRYMRGDESGADEAIKEGILQSPDDLGVQTAQAYIALRRNRIDVLGQLLSTLARDQGQRTEVSYYVSVLNNMRQNYAEGTKAFERAVFAEPTNYDMYVARGNDALMIVARGRTPESESKYQAEAARTFFSTALTAKPESAEALTGLALVNILTGKTAEAVGLANGATKAAPSYAAGFYCQSMVYSVMEADLRSRAENIRRGAKNGIMTNEERQQVNRLLADAAEFGRQSTIALNTSMKLDPATLGGRKIPQSIEVFDYFYRHGRLPLLVPPK